MDWDHIARNWQQFNQRVRAKWKKLTDDDLAMINGRRNRLEVEDPAALRLFERSYPQRG